ncbi:hypothetical protein BDW42DRAFT_189131 [Aspergillus taichungensis]|uniref:Alpha-1,6-mannosyltransferase subunit n=1 Tax=Aspergillus taichungensis TaxID=482145 RepID=A0A2J5HFR6_9EURO|nr:hypothetical protein BDW42DRAFT_189131 [Aspergillus taichungensis]
MLVPYRSLPVLRLSIAVSFVLFTVFLYLYYRPANLVDLKALSTIWYKVGPKGLNDDAQKWRDDCLRKNPTFRSEVLTDSSGDLFVQENFAFRPDIVDTYLALPIPIVKADFLRYLILYSKGGVWNDLDVSCEDTPIRDWIPQELKDQVNLVVGWEFDVGWGENIVRQFATWTVLAKPKSPHLMMVIDDILDAVRQITEEHQINIPDLTTDIISDVVDFTGPRRLTRGVIRSLESSLQKSIDNKEISHLLEPILVGDVLILPGYSLARSTNTYETNNTGPAFVTHHYAGSWKNKLGGEVSANVHN